MLVSSPDIYAVENARGELKFVIPGNSSSAISSWVRLHPARFRKAHPDRWVNSVYFDNADLDAYRENLAGTSRRLKVRYRWYGDIENGQSGQLEFKLKRNSCGWKYAFATPGFTLRDGDTWASAISNLTTVLPTEPSHNLETYHCPVILVRYLRRYFISSDGRFRITVDHNLTAFPQFNRSHVNLHRTVGQPHTETVIELKFSIDHWNDAAGIVEGIPTRRSRFSKYVSVGAIALDGA